MALRILLADDDPEARSLITLVVGQDPALLLVGEAEDGYAAIALARQHRPDVILMDVLMPFVDGLEATQLIKQQLPGTKVLVLTSLTDEYTLRAAFANGADSFVDKREIATRLLHAIWNAAARRDAPPPDPGRYGLRNGPAGSSTGHW